MHIQLLFTLLSALMILFHTVPVQINAKYRKDIEKTISKVNYEIEVLRAVCSLFIPLKHSIANFDLVSEFVINAEEQKEEYNNTKKSTNIR